MTLWYSRRENDGSIFHILLLRHEHSLARHRAQACWTTIINRCIVWYKVEVCTAFTWWQQELLLWIIDQQQSLTTVDSATVANFEGLKLLLKLWVRYGSFLILW